MKVPFHGTLVIKKWHDLVYLLENLAQIEQDLERTNIECLK